MMTNQRRHRNGVPVQQAAPDDVPDTRGDPIAAVLRCGARAPAGGNHHQHPHCWSHHHQHRRDPRQTWHLNNGDEISVMAFTDRPADARSRLGPTVNASGSLASGTDQFVGRGSLLRMALSNLEKSRRTELPDWPIAGVGWAIRKSHDGDFVPVVQVPRLARITAMLMMMAPTVRMLMMVAPSRGTSTAAKNSSNRVTASIWNVVRCRLLNWYAITA